MPINIYILTRYREEVPLESIKKKPIWRSLDSDHVTLSQAEGPFEIFSYFQIFSKLEILLHLTTSM